LVVNLFLPGFLIASLFSGSILASWPHNQLVARTKSLLQTASSVVQASLYEPSPYLLNPPLYRLLDHWGFVLFVLLGVAVLWRSTMLAFDRTPEGAFLAAGPRNLALFFAAALFFTLAAHRLFYRFFHVLMPVGRTAVFLAPLGALLIGSLSRRSRPITGWHGSRVRPSTPLSWLPGSTICAVSG
jgi:hypothetical protein